MTAKSLVLHIGDPKTGTTSIQEVLLRKLFATPGLTVDSPAQLNSFPLANVLCDPKQAAMRDARFGAMAGWLENSTADVAIVSAEQFFRVNPLKLQDTLTELVPEYAGTVRVLAYVRPHASRMVSAFLQRTRSGLFKGNLNTLFEQTRKENLLTYAPRFDAWRQVFGDRFTLRPMIRDELFQADVVSDFFQTVLQGRPFKLPTQAEANTSLPLEFLAGLREVQIVLRRNNIGPGTRNLVGDQIGRTLLEKWPNFGTKLQLTEAVYDRLKKHCADDAAALDAAFFDRPIMSKALDEARHDTVATGQALPAKAYFTADSITELRSAALKLVTMFTNRPTAWPLHFERKIGQRPALADGKPLPPPIRAHIEKVNGVLTEIADLIGGTSQTKAG